MPASAGTVVCGVDDSNEAREAVRVAARLAEGLGCRLVLVTVATVRPVPGARTVPSAYAELEELERRGAEELLDRVAADAPLAGATERRVEAGDPGRALVAIADEEEAELVVLGSRRRGALAAKLLGSVSMHVVQQAPCPVVLVPGGTAVRAT